MMVDGFYVALITLDSSSAFDTIDHQVLIKTLHDNFGVEGEALKLLNSYLYNRSFSVVVGGQVSAKKTLTSGVPQGSLLSPLLYNLYTKGVENVVKAFNHTIMESSHMTINIHAYADDIQLYFAFKSDHIITAQHIANDCLSKLKHWMDINYIKLNTDKTTLKIFSPNKTPLQFQINHNNDIIEQTDLINILGIKLNKDLNFTPFVSRKVQVCYMHLRNLFHVKKYLPLKSRITMVTNLIISQLDYCNSILICAKKKDIKPLQLALNRAIRFIFYIDRRSHITPFLKKLHILPIEYRIKYKSCLISYKIFHKLAPPYLIEQFPTFEPSTSISLRIGPGRDTSMFQLDLSKRETIYSKLKSEWNKLPYDLRMSNNLNLFKTKLKSHFFSMAF